MKSRLAVTWGIILLAGAAAASGWDVRKKIKMKDLPPAVKAAVMEQSKGATLRGLSVGIEKGKTYYEAELSWNDHARGVVFDADGKVVEIADAVKMEDLPAAAQAGLRTIAGTGKVERVESLTRNGQLVGYAAVIVTKPPLGRAGQHMPSKTEVQVDPAGNLAHFD
jgi:hypothetical protein